MRATMRMSLSLCSQRPTTRGSWTEEKQGAVSIGGECDAYQDNAKDNFDAVVLDHRFLLRLEASKNYYLCPK